MKKLYLFSILLLCSCENVFTQPSLDESSDSSSETSVSESVPTNDQRIPEPSYVYDSFDNGIDYDKWYISKRNWSATVSNGQKVENVNYTADGDLILSAKGNKFKGELQNTGGVIVSKDVFGPGKFEIAMKILPRLGVCNAFWTYWYESDDQNYEIDIELPGNKSYDHIIHTNWTGVNANQYTSTISPISPLNDNCWHKYTFEWKTNPQEIKYYVDDVLITTTTSHVPDVMGNLWCGVWLPNNWCGTPDFYEDYMLVDWIAYEKYEDQSARYLGQVISQVAAENEYPKAPVPTPTRNYIANGSFANQTVGFEGDITYIQSEQAGKVNSLSYQMIEEVYEGYTFHFSMSGKSTQPDSKVRFKFYDADDSLLQSQSLSIISEEYDSYMENLVAPENSKYLKVEFEGSELYIKDVLLTN